MENAKKCPECSHELEELKGSEVGNIFKLKDKYSQAFDLNYRDKKGEIKPVMMGCYGIGISRLLGVIVEANYDAKGIIWPKETAPFQYHLIGLFKGIKKEDKEIKKQTDLVYEQLIKKGLEVFYDDRESVSSGEKLVDADLLGLPQRIIISEKTLKNRSFELKERKSNRIKIVKLKDISKII